MTINDATREQVRQRANHVCEFCGVSETDTGGMLTIDHFHPKGKGGDDSLDNLLYCCCTRCNQYKLDYWATNPDAPQLWNPRQEPARQHFVELDNGMLHPLTKKAAFTLKRLRLNRPALVAHRVRKLQSTEELRLLTRYRDLIRVLEQLLTQQAALMEEQQKLLEEQRELLHLLLIQK